MTGSEGHCYRGEFRGVRGGFRLGLPLLAGLMLAPAAKAQDEADLAAVYGDAALVSIATGTTQLVARAPAVATVITAEEIERIGATDLDQLLETVPGLHVSASAIGYNPIYAIRGIHSEVNPQVLVLINGVPITNVFAGNRGQSWGGLPVQSIARVEVIRGPGSAIYGADAFAGVVNVITKRAGDIAEPEVGFRAGSFDSREGWALYGHTFNDLEIALTAQFRDSDGQDRKIRADAQSLLDSLLGTGASLAPSPVSLGRRSFDTRADLGYHDWRLRAWHQKLIDAGVGVGGAQTLDPLGRGDADRLALDLTYDNQDLWQDWGLMAQVSYFDAENRSNLQLFPPGAFGGLFPDGVIGNPDVFERHYRLDLAATYRGFSDHRLRVGSGYRIEDLYKVKETKNFCQPGGGFPGCPPPGLLVPPLVPLGALVDVSNIAPFVRERDRKVKFLSLQDEWDFAPDWTLTAGVRYDDYSDFGGTTNPRLALVWQTRFDLTTKLLYGRAFRAPAFAELFNINNPVALGNPDLDPETIDTYEVAFDWRPLSGLHGGLNLFYYQMDDIVQFVPDPAVGKAMAENTGQRTGHGLEWEMDWRIAPTLGLMANYALQRSRDKEADHAVGFAPTHQLYARLDWALRQNWNLDFQGNWVRGRKRAAGDPRSDVDDYATFDLTLRGERVFGHWGVAASVRNLFDTDAREPSLGPAVGSGLPPSIPGDLPLAGRTAYLELSYPFGL